ncbi:MAG: sulfatase-like hydrolase/transferase, partial [Pyramidobacter sp.]|nr:sulfatase-like hydrolase/transferase [Pyramidobacter sp.]
HKVMDAFEGAEGPVFIHNVTMQNHGAYNVRFLRGRQLAKVDKAYARFSDLVAYETLVRESDRALRALITWLKKQDRPVIVCFFGDHQPKLNDAFSQLLLERGKRPGESELAHQQRSYVVPYFIWANFEPRNRPPVNFCEDGQNMTSVNYLGAAVRCYAGLKLSAVERFLLKMRRTIPAINVNGYFAGGSWHGKDERTEYSSLLRDYSYVQHYIMFDENKKKTLTCAGN